MAKAAKTDKKIKRQKPQEGPLEALKQMEKKLMHKKLSANTNLRISPNPKKLFSFNARF